MPQSPGQRFRATIHQHGPNPYVDVPARVSRAFAAYLHGGRITVEGELRGAPIRGTLVPVAGKGHRLYVNGGMRSAAGVHTGDTVTFTLRAREPGDVRPSRDLAAALGRVGGARESFDSLAPSHRRELLRYIDDARTAESRRKRIQNAVGHALGKAAPASPRRAPDRPLWTCPKCGNEFVTRNMYHSCRRHSLEDAFAGKPPAVRALFERVRAMVESCGPVKVLPYGSKVGFMVRVRFAGVVPKRSGIDVVLWLTRRVHDPRFRKVETIAPNAHVHVARVEKPEDLDAQLASWMKEAYDVGCQTHLEGRRGP